MSFAEELKAQLDIPVIASPLFIISNPALVAAQCKSGIVGSFPALNARPAEVLDEWLQQLTNELSEYRAANPDKKVAPFAVNQIVHQSNDRLQHDLDLCAKYEVPLMITSLRAPHEAVEVAHSYGGKVFHDVISVRHAEKAIEAGVDGLILVCSGAGGHAGTLSNFALVSEVRKFYDGPIALSGSISQGKQILAAEAMGADFAYIGTRFIATHEANADEAYKQMLVDSSASDIVYSNLFTGVHGNYLRGSIEKSGLDPNNLPEGDKSSMKFGSGGSNKSKAWRDIWGAGQGVGNIDRVQSTAEVVAELKQDYLAARKRLLG
ncbi:NAD(P)H-dependent flavin oxidoreductase [Halopseudomonas salegens]|uniref:Nitronate monooxygenase n=1 Tax=Halopseudomonas salegens TaxID=1434072 RepID=A0A1H2ELQ2_9GAMM|nr:nitronate monooxygenase family protein [Halopseudomonas salegens]SDT95698.1 nitronate monooxygenase [Halopseudomonas salegens]